MSAPTNNQKLLDWVAEVAEMTTPDQIVWLYYDGEEPRFEPICEHKTEWKAMKGQFPHPHPSTDRQGKYIAFNVARDARTDVWVVTV